MSESEAKKEEVLAEQKAQDATEGADFDISLVKKKKKKKKKKEETTEESGEPAALGDHSWEGAGREYTYVELLNRVFRIIKEQNPNASDRKPHRVPPPELQRVGTRKTMWQNFSAICTALQRSQEHIMQFVMTELATEGSLDSKQRLVLRGRFTDKQIESLIKKYIMEYVTCNMCRRLETLLSRDPTTRLYFLSCSNCGSRRSVALIKSGFHATSRADRRAARA